MNNVRSHRGASHQRLIFPKTFEETLQKDHVLQAKKTGLWEIAAVASSIFGSATNQ